MWLLLFTTAAAAAGVWADVFTLSDEQYYEMPKLFQLDEYVGCLSTRGVYCLGSFELQPLADHAMYERMKKYSANWVDNFNHTRLHRGVCVTRACRDISRDDNERVSRDDYEAWFTSCINATMQPYNVTANLYRLEYCRRGPEAGATDDGPLTLSERGLAGLVAALLALAAVSTVLDMTLSDHSKKGLSWALSWSVPACWRSLTAPPPPSDGGDLTALDGLRLLCMMCVIIEHVCWLGALSYVSDTRIFELTRRAVDGMLMTNSTLVVQIFFLMSSFLLANKLLVESQRAQERPAVSTFFSTMLNRIVRISPGYFVVVWFASSWWPRLGSGPLWGPLVEAEAAICRGKWWTHLLYLNNIVYADDKCLIQTWYLAADMQLYAVSLAITLALRRCARAAVWLLSALLATSVAAIFALAYLWRLIPTFMMHNPELVRDIYSSEPSFNVLYQSPLGNLPGALAGLLLAHAHHAILRKGTDLNSIKWFRWLSVSGTPLAVFWAAMSPRLLGPGPPAPLGAAVLAAVERPVFAFFVAVALLGAMHNVHSPFRVLLSWRGWTTAARLSFGALLLHMPLDKALVASRLVPSQIDRQTAIYEWFSVAGVSYLAALSLALLVEWPFLRLYRALTTHPRPTPPRSKTDM